MQPHQFPGEDIVSAFSSDFRSIIGVGRADVTHYPPSSKGINRWQVCDAGEEDPAPSPIRLVEKGMRYVHNPYQRVYGCPFGRKCSYLHLSHDATPHSHDVHVNFICQRVEDARYERYAGDTMVLLEGDDAPIPISHLLRTAVDFRSPAARCPDYDNLSYCDLAHACPHAHCLIVDPDSKNPNAIKKRAKNYLQPLAQPLSTRTVMTHKGAVTTHCPYILVR